MRILENKKIKQLKILGTGFFMATILNAQEVAPFGAGLMVGSPTGATLKYNFTDNDAIEAAAGFAFVNRDHEYQFHAGYLRHLRSLISLGENGGIDMHFGAGLRLATLEHRHNRNHKHHNHDLSVGIRGPVGLDYTFKKVPIEVFAEVAAVFVFKPDSEVDFDVGAGARYYF